MIKMQNGKKYIPSGCNKDAMSREGFLKPFNDFLLDFAASSKGSCVEDDLVVPSLRNNGICCT